MSYDFKGKLKAKEYVKRIRASAFCEVCGSQPIEFHRKEHEFNGNKRIAHLVALGFPIKVIQTEIDKCEALCRSCHMKEDGRLKALRKNCPNQKGAILVLPIPCISCGFPAKPTRQGMCRECYDKQRRGR